MSFIWPAMLVFMIVLPIFVGLYLRMLQRRKQLVAQYGNLGLVQGAMGRGPGIRRHIPPALFLTGLAILILALARPQTVVHLPSIEGTVMLVFDVSGSMAADDLKPSRMEAAKAAARDFVASQPSSVKIGVVAFSDNGFAIQVPTDNQDAILAAIGRMTPQRGTSLAHGIMAALNTIAASSGQEGQANEGGNSQEPTPTPTPVPDGTYINASIVLLTDGENNEPPDPFEAAQIAADRGVRIHTIGIGSAAGTIIEVEGFTVHTMLDEGMLKQISAISGGTYFNAQTEQDLQAIYDKLTPQLVFKPETTEITSIFAGASILFLLAGGMFSLLWFSRLP